MSKLVARMQKMKSENLIGIGNHNQRKTKNHSNKDIDVTRSHLNYDLVNRTLNYKKDIEKYINDNKASKRAVRKDAVLLAEWIVTSDSNFFENMNHQEIKAFFESVVEYFSERNGFENIRYATVHLDENTPHMHLGIVPFDDDNKLSAKRVFNRETLLDIQNTLPQFLEYKGFGIERGDKDSKAKHLSVSDYKKVMRELEENKAELENVQFLIEESKVASLDAKFEFYRQKNSYEVKEALFDKNKVVIDKEYFEMLTDIALKTEVERESLDTEYEIKKIELVKTKEKYEKYIENLSLEEEKQSFVFQLKEKEFEKREKKIAEKEKKADEILNNPLTIEQENQKKLVRLRKDYAYLKKHTEDVGRENFNLSVENSGLIRKNDELVSENKILKLRLEKTENYLREMNQIFSKFYDIFHEKMTEIWKGVFLASERLVDSYFGQKMYDFQNNKIPVNISAKMNEMELEKKKKQSRQREWDNGMSL